jgi:hypothetical protein
VQPPAAAFVGGPEDRDPRFTFTYVVFNSYHDDVRAEVDRQSRAFGEDLGDDGIFMEPFEGGRQGFADRIKAWPWPNEVRDRIDTEGEPIILVVRGRMTQLDPQSDQWAIIWLSDFEGAPYSIKPLFQTLARKTRADEDVIVYIREVAERRQRRGTATRAARVFAHVGGYIDWKPTIPFIGVGIDVKAILADIADAASKS